MRSKLTTVLKAPEFASEEETNTANLLNVTLLTLITLTTIIPILFAIFFDDILILK